ncbi:cell division protein FtsZ [Rickettsia endosymbiont of Cantharis rufa]|uniref:cell division protein FtsZ n=1 Tax=Rickettsia endosymbiont of Cantharis rufa TaxID=3066248 RepID=UPI003132BAC5
MVLNIKAPENIVLKPTITVFGVGGAGSNAVNNMISANLQGANFVVANTDAQSLEHSLCTNKIQLGVSTTRGLGAGASPEVGALAAQESESEIRSYLENSNMVFITAGMGGGTGTGSSPVIARIAKELGILTVGVVTKPFHFEGGHRMKTADKGLIELQQFVDTLIVIPNQNLFRIANEQTTFADAFKMADDVLHAGVRGVTDLMIMPGLINLDFADIKAVMSEMGKAMMGTGEASGEDRAIKAAESAISNPLLDHSSMCGARGVLINITGGSDMTLFEVDNAANRIREEVDNLDANIIFGSTFNPELKGIIRVSVVATGIDADKVPTYKPTAETTITVPEEAYNEAIAQPTQIEEIPDFNSYSTENIEITDSPINQNFTVNEDELGLHVNNFNKSEGEAQKPSFLGKIWGSLRTSNNQTLERKNVVVSTLDQDDKESDIHDIPAFLRKKRD